MSLEEIRRFFEPESVAVVGASRDAQKAGSVLVQNLLKLGYPGKLWAINPHAGEILGVSTLPSVAALTEKVDLVIMAVPAAVVPGVMRDCARKGIRNVAIISSGFGEAGETGQKILRETLKIAQEGGIRILGPNTTGILNPRFRFTTTFVPLTGEIKQGGVSFIAQTGMFAGVMLYHLITAQHFGISKVAGLGNKSDVDEADVLEYLLQDEDTRTVMLYLEGMKDGRRFLEAARRFTRRKPLVAVKGGRTLAGAKAALAHTGSLAGQYPVTKALFQQAGIILAHDLEEMLDFAKILAFQPLPRGPRVGIVSISGAAAVMASDATAEAGLVVASLAPERLSNFQKLLPAWALATHPIDLEPVIEMVGVYEGYRLGLEAVLLEPGVDMCLLFIGAGLYRESEERLVTGLAPLLRRSEKPLAIVLAGAKPACEILTAQFEDMGVPVYPTVSRASNSLAALYQFASGGQNNSQQRRRGC